MNWLRSFFRSERMTWTPGETLIMRVAFAVVIMATGIIWNAGQLPLPTEALKEPNGIARILPLRWMAEPAVLNLGKPLVAVTLLLYAVGVMPVLTLFPALLYMLGTGSLRNSMGDISHHTQIVAMVLLAQWIVYVWDAIKNKSWIRPSAGAQERVVFWSILMIGASYFASGIVKLKASDFMWIQRVPALSVQVFKAVWSASYSTGLPVSGFKAETAPWLIVHHPHLARLFFGVGLVLELAGWFMVLSRRHARWIGLGLIGMHVGISLLMEIEFWNHMLLVLIFAVNVPGWIKGRGKTTAASASAPS